MLDALSAWLTHGPSTPPFLKGGLGGIFATSATLAGVEIPLNPPLKKGEGAPVSVPCIFNASRAQHLWERGA